MKILLATDGSPHAEEAAWLLSHVPHEEKLELTVLTVLQVPYVHSGLPTKDWMPEVVQRERSFADQAYRNVAEFFEGADAELRHVVTEGHIGQSIVDEAKAEETELVVLGARGHSTVDRILLGSTSDFVATHASCSVLIVRPTGLRSAPGRPLRVTLAYDDSSPSQRALQEVRRFCWGKTTEFTVVSVVSFISAFLNEVVVDPAERKAEALRSAERAAEEVRDVAPQATAQLVESDHIADGLVDFVESHRADLLVMGDTGRSGLSRFLLGSVSRFALRHAHCSVWIAREPQ